MLLLRFAPYSLYSYKRIERNPAVSKTNPGMNIARDAPGPLKLVKSRIMLPISRQSNAAAKDMRSCSAHPYLTENIKIIAYIGKPKEKSKPRDMRWNTPF